MAATARRVVATPPSLCPTFHGAPRPTIIAIGATVPPVGTRARVASHSSAPATYSDPNPIVSDNVVAFNEDMEAVYRPLPMVESPPTTPTSGSRDSGPRCLICFEPKPFAPSTTPRCTHTTRVCEECLARHLQISVCDRGFTNVTCPVLSCREVLSYTDMKTVVKDQSVLDRYERLLLRRTLDKLPNFVWCKNPSCSSGQIHDSDSPCANVKCNACEEESCFKHDVPWHTGLSCSQYDAKMKQTGQAGKTRASENYISKNAKACPNPSCGRMIEKAHGCDHMTCMEPMGCGHEFCWCCLADYKPIHERGNHYHKRRCRHYDSRLKLAIKRALVWILRL